MKREEAIKMAKAKLKCLENDTSGSYDLCDNDCENCILNYDQGNMGQQKEWLSMLINDAETVEQFENAQIITSGRLNGRAYAYKCGLEEGKRKALEKKSSWIPVSAGLPKKSGDYLTTISFDLGDTEPAKEVYKNYFCGLSQKWLTDDEDVLAWMPAPKPYEGSENANGN